MWRNPFVQLNRKDWLLLSVSLLVVGVSNALVRDSALSTRLGSLIGVVALIFMAKGDVWGQILTVVFSILYGITSWHFRYYGEMITYLCMTLPMAVLAVFSWLRHPYEGNTAQVEIACLHRRQWIGLAVLAVLVTTVLGLVLWWLDTPNLGFSILSVTTSFVAAYLTYHRSPYYAVGYALNDVVLIVLWALASVKESGFTPMIACFGMFLVNDLYAFFAWKHRRLVQQGGEG